MSDVIEIGAGDRAERKARAMMAMAPILPSSAPSDQTPAKPARGRTKRRTATSVVASAPDTFPARAGRDQGLTICDTHTQGALVATQTPAKPATARTGEVAASKHASSSPDPTRASPARGRTSESSTPKRQASASDPIPVQAGRDRGHTTIGTHSSDASVATDGGGESPRRRTGRARFRATPRIEPPVLSAPTPPPDEAATISAIRELAFWRRQHLRALVRDDNQVGSGLRRGLGWRYVSEAEAKTPEGKLALKANENARKGAAGIWSAFLKHEPIPPEHAEVAAHFLDHLGSFAAKHAISERERDACEKKMQALVRKLAVNAWRKTVRGFGELSLAVIIGEAGNIGEYRTVSGLWKRLGLAVINGERQQKKSGDAALEHNYKAERRAQIWAFVGEPMIKAQWASDRDEDGKPAAKTKKPVVTPAHALGPYGEVYAYEKAKAFPRIAATAHLPDKVNGYRNPAKWTPARVDRHAKRLMTKALLRDLWRVWRGLPPRGNARITDHEDPTGDGE